MSACSPSTLSPSSGSVAGKKRKHPMETKYYAVRVGHKPGIYNTYAECLAQVQGFKGAQFKSFTSTMDAEQFIRYGLAAVQHTGPQKWYAVKVGRRPGIYLDWPSAQAQIKGTQKPKFKSFTTEAEAKAYMSQSESASPVKKEKGVGSVKAESENIAPENPEDIYPPATGPLPEYSTDGFDDRIWLNPKSGEVEYKPVEARGKVKMQAYGLAPDAWLEIYTDGSSVGNGKLGARAGVGVWFGNGDPRNIAERLSGSRQTNQRAELTGIVRALQQSPLDRNVRIHTDSKYAISCVTEWFHNWEANNWVTANKKPVENKDLVQQCLALMRERDSCGSKTSLVWVKGHDTSVGNNAADTLAVEGARK